MHLNEEHINFVLTLINEWRPDVSGTLTWNRVIDNFKKKFNDAPSDRTFRNHNRLQHRFTEKKSELKNGGGGKVRAPSSLRVAAQKITNLENEIEYLKKQNTMFLERLMMYQKNAHDHGMTKEELERPLAVRVDTVRNNS